MNAAHAQRQILILDTTKSCRFDHLSEMFLLRKLANTLNQILVRMPLAGEHLSHGRYHRKRILVVQPASYRKHYPLVTLNISIIPLKRSIVEMTEFKTHEAATGTQHTIRFGQYPINVCTISNSKSYCIRCESIVVERQLFGISANPINVNISIGDTISQSLSACLTHI